MWQIFCMKYFDMIINGLMNHQLGKKAFAWVLFLPMCVCAFAQEHVQNAFTSPNGKIGWRAEEKGKQVQAFSITYIGHTTMARMITR